MFLGSFWPIVFSPWYCSSGFGISGFGGLKTLYICIIAMYFDSSYVVEDHCIEETDRE